MAKKTLALVGAAALGVFYLNAPPFQRFINSFLPFQLADSASQNIEKLSNSTAQVPEKISSGVPLFLNLLSRDTINAWDGACVRANGSPGWEQQAGYNLMPEAPNIGTWKVHHEAAVESVLNNGQVKPWIGFPLFCDSPVNVAREAAARKAPAATNVAPSTDSENRRAAALLDIPIPPASGSNPQP